ncbi:MAG TPA: D-aminoacyl-tRNA deacylase [Dinghuibacter sp.]|uniref:D-aminoacyl-tRNA deacylase n=1 Tax=Dinghuibacter sp. TaxID=2024697 RepID=UPI002D02AF04|nr:D-aminoacyl-tRNA deacylase [Dinghuibacter sp.]HTJ10762.1 D-aminoacyl-tRNA deacylase [Dinghuibacter sp.]
MRAVIQRVSQAAVTVDGMTTGAIGPGLLVLLGVEDADTPEELVWLSGKIVGLRIFNDDRGVMNLPIRDSGGDILLVSQFTLHASTKKGNRPSYIRASKAAFAEPMYEQMIRQLGADLGRPVQTGRFGADMQVSLVNDGPVTIFIDTKNKE